MPNALSKKKKIGLAVGTVLTVALYIYSIYSVHYIFKHKRIGEIVLYTALISICNGLIIFLYTLVGNKKEFSKSQRIILPVITAIIHAGIYLSAAIGIEKIVSVGVGSDIASGLSLIMFGVSLALLLNCFSSGEKKAKKIIFKAVAVVCAVSFIVPSLSLIYNRLENMSFLSPIYSILPDSNNIGGIQTSDKDIVYDFAYATEKDVRNTALGADEIIDIKLAKNEWEGFQIVFATTAKDKKVNVSVTDFKNADGETLKTEAFKEHYLKVPGMGNIYNCEYPDALIPVTHTGKKGGSAELEKGLQQAFFIRTRAEKDAKAGPYTAVLTAVNENEEVILEKEIVAEVWNFVLPDTPANDTAFGADGEDAYELLLENRISPYSLPCDILDDEADKYMSDPRRKFFLIPYADDDEKLVAYYTKVTSNPDWARKACFYPIDEPTSESAYAEYTEMTDRLNRLCPNYNMVTPFNTAKVTVNGEEQSSVKLQEGKSSILCGLSKVINSDDGILNEMLSAAEQGSKAWWYVCCSPGGDYCNFFEHMDAIRHRILMWQQKALNITGLLYWSTTYYAKANPWESTKTWDNYDASGDGMLIYPGDYIGYDGVIPSLRLVNIADGMEDYDYFALAQEKFGREWVDEKIAQVTTTPTEYNSDHANLEQVRRSFGEALCEA